MNTTAPTKQAVTAELIEVTNRMLGRGAPVVWDGAGFSKMDHPFASSLVDQFNRRGELTTKQVVALQKMLRKYSRQLASIDHNADLAFATFADDTPPAPAPEQMSATKVGSRIFLNTHGYSPATNELIKQIPGRRFHPATGSSVACWSFPQESIHEAAGLFPTNTDVLQLREELKAVVFAPQAEVVEKTVDRTELENTIRAEVPGLFEHQVEGIAAILSQPHFLLADDMGLGKTRQAIIAANRRGTPNLVICPASLKKNWYNEIKMVDPNASVHIVRGSNGPSRQADWNVINYDILGRNAQTLRSMSFVNLLIDEAHYIKNDSQRSDEVLGHEANEKAKTSKGQQAYEGLINRAQHTVLLTGTPLMSRPKDLFNLLRAIRHPLGKNFFAYGKRYCNATHNGFGWDFSGASNLGELGQKVADRFLQRKKDQCLDLPEKVRSYQEVELNGDRKEYEDLEDELESQYAAGETIRLAVLGGLKAKTAELAVKASVERIESILEGTEKVLVFSNYTLPVDALKSHFGDAAVVVDGRTPIEKRQTIVDEFQSDPTKRVFIGNLKAAGVGLNLTAATQVVINDMDWVPANHSQAEDRAYRIGQRNAVTVTYIVPEGTLAEWLRDLNEGKAEIVGTVEQSAMDWVVRQKEARKQK